MNVVFDTNVLLSATVWDGSEAQKLLFDCLRRGDINIIASPYILDEYRAKMTEELGFSIDEQETAVMYLLSFLNLIRPSATVDMAADADDNPVLACAVTAEASYLVTYDNHLLDVEEFEDVSIVSPVVAQASL